MNNMNPEQLEGLSQKDKEMMGIAGSESGVEGNSESYAERYQGIIDNFKSMDVFDDERVRHFQELGDEAQLQKIMAERQEAMSIIAALESGNEQPAREKLTAMIEKNIQGLRAGVPAADIAETLRRLADMLAILKS